MAARRSRRTTLTPPARELPLSVPLRPRERVEPYDFRRPRRANPELLDALAALGESLGRTLATSLTTMLRSTVTVKLAGVEEQTYARFIAALDNPSCACVIRPAPFEARWLLDLGPAIFYPIIDRMLGGGGEKTPIARRPATEIELRLAARIASVFLAELAAAWRWVADLACTIERFETNPASAALAAADEAVAVTRFDVVTGDAGGAIRLGMPLHGLEQLGAKLTSGGWAARGALRACDAAPGETARVDGAVVELVAHLAQTTIRSGELVNLRVGDIIATEQQAEGPIALSLGGTTKFLARPGAFKGHKAACVEQVIAPPGD